MSRRRKEMIQQSRLADGYYRMNRQEAATQQGQKCQYCYSGLNLRNTTADHRKAKSKGGSDHRHNIVAACFACNQAKANMTEARFIKAIKQPPQPGAHLSIMLAWMRRKINLRAERSARNLQRMFIGERHNPVEKQPGSRYVPRNWS